MCFSAGASFGASAVIAVIGIASLKKTTTLSQRVLAMIPLFFAIQQFIEGFLWIALQNPEYEEYRHALTLGFLFFAWLIWPFYIPFSMLMLEKNIVRRRILLSFLAIGTFVTCGFLYVMIFRTVVSSVAAYHINYMMDFEPPIKWFFGLLYLIPTVGSMMVSSVKRMWGLGFINFSSYVFSRIFFFGYVVSVWCFFGALASVIILWYIIQLNKVVVTDEQNVAQSSEGIPT